jgi:hypothetical protein
MDMKTASNKKTGRQGDCWQKPSFRLAAKGADYTITGGKWAPRKTLDSSSPRKRGPSKNNNLDSRFRGNDDLISASLGEKSRSYVAEKGVGAALAANFSTQFQFCAYGR